MSKLTQSPAWQALREHASQLGTTAIADLFAQQPDRADRFTADATGLHLDYAKQRATPRTLELLLALARQQGLERWIAALFGGEPVNSTERRAALHMALRNVSGRPMTVDGRNAMPEVDAVLDRVCAFAEALRGGAWRGQGGARIADIVNLGIGGSDLGPRMVCEALQEFADGPRTHFVSNVDGAQIAAVLARLKPESTLFVVTSKTFTTQETMANARSARAWLVASLGEAAVARHFAAVSANVAEAEKFGIPPANVFGFWDWVGGRYSLWSAVGLCIVVALGPARFRELLGGAHAMDEHFRSAPWERNLPVLMGLLSVWNLNFLGCASQVVAPYAQFMEHFIAWLQQLELESNGKGVDRDGQPVDYGTAPALWGDVGTNAQHAFFQMLHQGPAAHAVDFILPVRPGHALAEQHEILVAHCLAQSAAMMSGARAEPHRTCPGNRPSNVLLLPRLDPFHLGALLALYEHRTFVQSVVWNINPFDQWGVELGKRIAQSVLAALQGGSAEALDPATRRLVTKVRGMRLGSA
ncbi:MAG: glucose-6-phosphate isomerase [Gammaproteobacteria bacterium]|nr:glucose-6-phosphate isomerase [Gammaproteobacteria bacterium]